MNITDDQIVLSVGMDDLTDEKNWQATTVTSVQCLGNETSVNNCSSTPQQSGSNLPELDTTKVVVLTTIIVLTVLGNVAVIVAIVCRKMKMNRMYYFILHLSLADLLTAFLTLLPEVVWTFTIPYFYGGTALCKMVKFGQMIGPYLSSYVLIMTAVDRYQAICYPLSNCSWTPRRSNIMIGTAWAIALILCIPQAIIFSGDKADDGGPRCVAHFVPGWGVHAYVTWFAVSSFFVPLLFLLFCYTRICWAIWENFNNKKLSSSAESGRGIEPDTDATRGWRIYIEKLRGLSKPSEVLNRYRLKSSRLASTDDNFGEDSDNSRESADRHWQDRDKAGAGEFQLTNITTRITVEPPSTPSGVNDGNVGDRSVNFSHDQIDAIQSIDKAKSSGGHVEGRATFAPRSSSIKGISRAKIKTVKLTVVVIVGYIVCSAPFICVQLWATFGSPSDAVLSSMVWLFWLLTLNSVVNPWIYMMFNANLVESLCQILCRTSWSARSRGSERHRRLRMSQGGRIFGQSVSRQGRANSTLETGNDALTCPSGTGRQLTAKQRRPFERSRSNSAGSQTSYTIMTTTECGLNGQGRRSPSPHLQRPEGLPVIDEKNN